MKKHAPKILAIVLLTAIAVLTVVAGTGNFGKNVFASEKTDGANKAPDVVLTPAEAVTDEATQTPDKEVVKSDKKEVFTPIPPQKSQIYAYFQRIAFDGDFALNAVHTTSEGGYIVVTHATKVGAKNSRVSVVKMAFDGTYERYTDLTHGRDGNYLTSAVTSDGLVVVVNDGGTTYIDTVSYDLNRREILELEKADSAKIYALDKGFLAFVKGRTEAVYKIEDNVIKAHTALQSGEIKEVYDFGSYFSVFVNGINGYSIIKLDSALKNLGGITVPERIALAVQPVVRDGKQKYLVCEAKDGSVEIAEYFADFSLATATRVGVGRAEKADVFMKDNRVFLLLHATTDRLYLIGEELDYIASSSTVMQGITTLEDCSEYEYGFIVLYRKGESLVMLDLRDDGTEESRNFNVNAKKAFVYGVKGEWLAVAYAVDGAVEIIGIDG